MNLRDTLWPWGAVREMRRDQQWAKDEMERLQVRATTAGAERDRLRREVKRLEEVIRAQRRLISQGRFRDPNTGILLDFGVLPPPRKEVNAEA